MLKKLNNINDLEMKANDYLDCYVSTDALEIEELLNQVGFTDTIYDEKYRKTLYDNEDDDFDLYRCSLKDEKTSLEIDCVDVSLEEALKTKTYIDFMPMSKFRIYTNGCKDFTNRLCLIIKSLDAEKQNMAFINNTESAIYVKLSEFYR